MKGRIVKIIGGKFSVYDPLTNETIVCSAAGRLRSVVVDETSSFNNNVTLKKKKETKTIKLTPKVGDFCEYEANTEFAQINEIYPRENEMVRPLISNVDQLFLIFSSKKPDFSFLLLDQFLVLTQRANIKAKIIVTKISLLTNDELSKLKEDLNYYNKIGYEVYFVDSLDNINIDLVKPLFKDKISVLSGQTGAGKSTLINALIPGFKLPTQEISKALNRGKHTTRHSELYSFLGGFIGDTPGFSKLDFSLIEKEEFKSLFIEFENYNCKYRGCLHNAPDGCKVIEAVNNKEILESRYNSYIKFFNETKNMKKKY